VNEQELRKEALETPKRGGLIKIDGHVRKRGAQLKGGSKGVDLSE